MASDWANIVKGVFKGVGDELFVPVHDRIADMTDEELVRFVAVGAARCVDPFRAEPGLVLRLHPAAWARLTRPPEGLAAISDSTGHIRVVTDCGRVVKCVRGLVDQAKVVVTTGA